MLSRKQSRIGLALCAVTAIGVVSMTPVTQIARACFGYTPPPPPMPECFKSYTLSFSIPQTILHDPAGVVVPIKLNHFVAVREAVPQVPVCPPGPYIIRSTADITCDDGTVIAGIPLTDVAHPGGGNVCAIDALALPLGLGCCTIKITSTVLFEPGCALTQMQKQQFCVVEPSDSDPSVPRLKLELINPLDIWVHPGDQSLMCYTLTNCDDDQCVEVTLDADMRNVAGAPMGGDPTTTIIVADPTGIDGDVGDNFPIFFEDELLPPFFCVPLPPDPGAEPIPVITRTIKLDPLESIEIKIASRPWPMCADGSCGHSLVRAFGLFDGELDLVKACASAIVVVNNFAPPQFAWPDAGVVGCMGPDPIGGGTGVGGFGFPFPDKPTVPVDFCLIPLPQVQFGVNGQPTPVNAQFGNVLQGAADLGKWNQRFDLNVFPPPGSFQVDSFFDITYQIQIEGGFKGVNQGAILQDIAVAQGSPQGLETVAPAGMGNLLLPVPDPLCPDVLAQLTQQITANAETSFGDVVPIEIVALSLQAAGPDLIQVNLAGQPLAGFPQRGFPEVVKLSISNDFRAFFSPKVPVCPTDFDGDGDVDLGDFGIFGAAFNSVVGDANYNPAADFDQDGDVDLGDFGVFGADFGRTDC